ncbi:hypothetical protein BJ138DRAFT_779579 [Hygrophoropsis aurantiaca]|uniref:Uncharacterized protein n=1 Tax=Hygrophoropsis aurantiaca TaxID=72124 RepID=A0ACB7ZW80_9AGAM|nr:hypothetical protein BJ138DRAFT_779579 [Hygrophoropsis aurantiaca]
MGNHTEQHDTNVHTAIKIIDDEVLELEKQELDLLMRLRPLQDTIAHKRSLAGTLKNSLVPVNRLPNEILLACFDQAVQDWADEKDGADEQAVAQLAHGDWTEDDVDFGLPFTPVLAISHVSHHWRQLAINAPSLWTNVIVTPAFGRHMDIFRDVLHRAKGMPIAANFRSFEHEPISSDVSPMEAIIPLIHAQQINALSFLSSPPILSFLSRVVEQTTQSPSSPPSIAFSSLITLSIFGLYSPKGLTLGHLKSLLSAAPQLKTLELQYDTSLDTVERADQTVITLPMLENLTIIQATDFVCILLNSLSAPNICQLKLLTWYPCEDFATYCLFINDSNNVDPGLGVPRFPKVQNLTLSAIYCGGGLHANIIRAFPRVTHLTLRSPSRFYWIGGPASLPLPRFKCLQHLTLDFAFEYADVRDIHGRFTWLQKSKNQADRPLPISLNDRSTESMQGAKKQLFRYYKELQQYGEFAVGSSRLDEFMRWQADDEPAILA